MSRNFPREDSVPWYRQFWPWFLIALPAAVVVAGLTTVVIANKGADDLVVDEYYKNGLAINRKLEKKERAAQLGIGARLAISDSDVVVTTDGTVTSAQLTLLLSHPLESNRDFEVLLVQSVPGEYRGRLTAPVAERWHWALIGGDDDEGWRLDGSITAADFSSGDGG